MTAFIFHHFALQFIVPCVIKILKGNSFHVPPFCCSTVYCNNKLKILLKTLVFIRWMINEHYSVLKVDGQIICQHPKISNATMVVARIIKEEAHILYATLVKWCSFGTVRLSPLKKNGIIWMLCGYFTTLCLLKTNCLRLFTLNINYFHFLHTKNSYCK